MWYEVFYSQTTLFPYTEKNIKKMKTNTPLAWKVVHKWRYTTSSLFRCLPNCLAFLKSLSWFDSRLVNQCELLKMYCSGKNACIHINEMFKCASRWEWVKDFVTAVLLALAFGGGQKMSEYADTVVFSTATVI